MGTLGTKFLKNLATGFTKISPEVLKKSARVFDFFRHRFCLALSKNGQDFASVSARSTFALS